MDEFRLIEIKQDTIALNDMNVAEIRLSLRYNLMMSACHAPFINWTIFQ